MKDLLEKLKQKVMVSAENISALRNYISKKHPNLSSREASTLLVNSIHKIIDNNLIQFDTDYRDKIRQIIIDNSVHKSSFLITTDEVLYAFADICEDKEDCINNLCAWIQEAHNMEVTKEELIHIIDEIKKLDTEYMIKDIQLEPKDILLQSEDVGEISNLPVHRQALNKYIGIAICGFLIALLILPKPIKDKKEEIVEIVAADEIVVMETRDINELPLELKYKSIEIEKLRAWLNGRNSRLADEPYLSAIVSTAQEFDINPILMIAIVGQEQGFVPRSHEYADRIANNPFNVYGSWVDYNTNILDSSKIAALTLVNLSKDRPSDIDPIQWINRKYAEDENWHKGVSKIFYMLNEELAISE
ncbi:MAG: hypothetical protein WDA24_05650 [Tissierellales bacterium]